MDAAAHYRHLVALGRDEFLAAAAPAALLRTHAVTRARSQAEAFPEYQVTVTEMSHPGAAAYMGNQLELYPLVKKPGASFPDRITIGRTPNNDICVPDVSVSRLHAYVRRLGEVWVVADAGSKNGSWLRGTPLVARKEQPLISSVVIRLGDVDLTFYLARDLFGVLGGSP